jgi:membrane-associated protein
VPSIHAVLVHSAFSIGQLLNPVDFLRAVGPWAIVVIVVLVFIETGLLFPFLPGDSLVFAAALLGTTLRLPLWILIPVVAATAIAGGHSGYAIGARIGPRLFKPDARIFKTKYRAQAVAFVARYGAAAIVLARFVPIVRTFIPPIVGMSQLTIRRFALWNAVGAIAWATIMGFAGFLLGKIPVVANNVDLIAVILVLVSVVPIVIDRMVHRRRERLAQLAGRELVRGDRIRDDRPDPSDGDSTGNSEIDHESQDDDAEDQADRAGAPVQSAPLV